MDINPLTYEQFEPMIGGKVVVTSDDGEAHPLKLINVERMTHERPDTVDTEMGVLQLRKESLSLSLLGPSSPVLDPQTYIVAFPGEEPQFLFVSPYEKTSDGILYSIVFN